MTKEEQFIHDQLKEEGMKAIRQNDPKRFKEVWRKLRTLQ